MDTSPRKEYVAQQMRIEAADYLPLMELSFAEDHAKEDVTSLATISPDSKSVAELISKAKGIVCGLEIYAACFLKMDADLSTTLLRKDGDRIDRGDIIAKVEGSTRAILAAERTALNFLGFLSGIATQTNQIVTSLEGSGIRILDTRKTLPGYRNLCKYAVHMGGGANHRKNLAEMGLIKDNHIAASDSIADAIRKFKSKYPSLPLEVEVENLDQLAEALPEKPDYILLDNMSPDMIRTCVQKIREFSAKHNTEFLVEASGGFNAGNIQTLRNTGVDFVSMGSLTHHVTNFDFSLEIT